ncbi:MAG: FmdB family zinc ribbon protein [Candidatus Aminicenantales bacterium]
MPIYEFKCWDCGQVTEFLVQSKFHESPSCDYCKSQNI